MDLEGLGLVLSVLGASEIKSNGFLLELNPDSKLTRSEFIYISTIMVMLPVSIITRQHFG